MSPIPDDPNQAQAWISGEAPDQTIDFYIPRGNRGPTGPQGPQGPSLSVGLVETVTGPVVPGTAGPQGLTGPKGDPGGWVGGTVLGTTDLNLIVTPGLYKQDNSANVTFARNYPREAVGGAVKVYDRVAPGASASVFQEFIPAVNSVAGTPIYWIRYSYNNHVSWSPWRMYASTRIDQSAGRAVYLWDSINDREQLLYGDTGLRNLEAEVLNGWVAGIFKIRRIGYEVTMHAYNLNPAARTASNMWTIPSGFRPIGSVTNQGFLVQGGGPFTTTVSDVLPSTAATSATGFVHLFKYTTSDAWPTTLPGTASGSVPI